MAYQRSNIGASLNKKRKVGLVKKIGAYFIFILFFISLAVLGLTKDQVRIKNIVVTGNSSVSTENILKLVEVEISKVYLWIIPTDNIILLREAEIENEILNTFKKIGTVNVYVHGIDKIEIAVTERESKNLWCKGATADIKVCYYMDSNGFIFEEAPNFSESAFPEYFGLIKDQNPVGQLYLKDNFKNISSLYITFKKMSFSPKYFNAVDEHEYEVYLVGGGKIILNDKRSFVSSLVNLQALVDNGYIKNDIESLKKIKYIDLRFGNKVNFELKTSL